MSGPPKLTRAAFEQALADAHAIREGGVDAIARDEARIRRVAALALELDDVAMDLRDVLRETMTMVIGIQLLASR